MARPRIYTNEQIIAALKETKGAVYLAADRVGCDPDTIYGRAKRSPEVARCIKNERGKVVDTAELKLYEAILAGEAWAITLTLKTQGKDRGYVEQREVRSTGSMDLTSGGQPLERHTLTPADLAAAAALLGMAGPGVHANGRS